MSQHGLLIRCAPPRPEDREDIERWLAGRVQGLAGEGALLYHFAPPLVGATPDGRGDAWVVEFAAARRDRAARAPSRFCWPICACWAWIP